MTADCVMIFFVIILKSFSTSHTSFSTKFRRGEMYKLERGITHSSLILFVVLVCKKAFLNGTFCRKCELSLMAQTRHCSACLG